MPEPLVPLGLMVLLQLRVWPHLLPKPLDFRSLVDFLTPPP